mgnify:CR=1 FL=1
MAKNNRINIAFCFDENMTRQACVTIASLLDYKEKDTHFNIYCVCTEGALRIQKYLYKIIKKRDKFSTLIMKKNVYNYDGGYEIRGITVSTYFRLNLHVLFPDVDKIIYSDVDILFQGDLMDVWKKDLEDNYIAGVKADVNIKDVWCRHLKDEYWKELTDWFGKYINAGFIIMNLKKIREDKMDLMWNGMIQKKYFYQDQDILNLTCKPHILFLPMEYNRFMFYSKEELEELRRNSVFTREEIEKAIEKPVVIHYAGEKPWNKYSVLGAAAWWNYVMNREELYYIFRADILKYKVYRKLVVKR